MRVLKHTSKTTIVFTGEGGAGTCPRMSITGQSSRLADDYHGRMRLNKKLISKFFGK